MIGLSVHFVAVIRGIISDDLRTMGELRPSPGEINKYDLWQNCRESIPWSLIFVNYGFTKPSA